MKHPTRKGQAQMTETIAIIFIFFVLVLFGLLFYSRYQKVSLQQEAEEILATKAMEITVRTLFLPELLCTKGEAEPEENCVDMAKVEVLKERSEEDGTKYGGFFREGKRKEAYYFDLLSNSRITLQEVFPEAEEPIVLYDNAKKDWTKMEPTYFVVSLKDWEPDWPEPRYRFGYLKVEVYS